MAFGTSYFLLLVLFQPQVAPVATVDQHELTSEDIPRPFLKGERRLGRVVLYRSIGTNTHFEQDPFFSRDRHQNPSRLHLQNEKDSTERYISHNKEYQHRYRPRFNNFPVEASKFFDKRIDNFYPKHSDTDIHARRQLYRPDRGHQSSSNYINTFNYRNWNENHGYHNNPHLNFYDDFRTRFRSDLPQGFYSLDDVEPLAGNGPGGYRHIIHSFPPLADINSAELPSLVHKDMTRAHFPGNDFNHNILGLMKEHHRFSPAIHNTYKGVPVYNNTNDGSSAGKYYDPRFLALYKSVLETYRNKQVVSKQGQPPQSNEVLSQKVTKPNKNSESVTPQQQIPPSDKITFLNFVQQIDKLHTISPHEYQRHLSPVNYVKNKIQNILEPNVGSLLINHISKFQPSPPYYKYSEPDPLYHSNRSPFQTYEPPSSTIPTTEPPTMTQGTLPHKTTIATHSTVKSSKFPDSINAQLPPPTADVDTRIPYVAATVVTPQTLPHDPTKATKFLQEMKRFTVPPTDEHPTTAKSLVTLQHQWDVGPKLSIQNNKLHHELPSFNISKVTPLHPILQEFSTTEISSSLQNVSTEETSLSTDSTSETTIPNIMSTTSHHFLPTIESEQNVYSTLHSEMEQAQQNPELSTTQQITSMGVPLILSQEPLDKHIIPTSFVPSTDRATNSDKTNKTSDKWIYPQNNILTHFEANDPKNEESYRIIKALQMSFGDRIRPNHKSSRTKIISVLNLTSTSMTYLNSSNVTLLNDTHSNMPNNSVEEITLQTTQTTLAGPDTYLVSDAHTQPEEDFNTTTTASTTLNHDHTVTDTESYTFMADNRESISETITNSEESDSGNSLLRNESTILVGPSLKEDKTTIPTPIPILLLDLVTSSTELKANSDEETSTQNVPQLSSTPLSHIMSLINHVRTHIILSRNNTESEESSWDKLY